MATKIGDNNGGRMQRRGRMWTWGVVASAVLLGAAASASAQTVFDNFNTFAVGNGPTAPTTFTLSSPTSVTQLITYHWNFGHGVAPGTIKLQGASGRFYGPYGTAGVVGSNNVQNAAWVATIGGLTLPADTYTVVDSDPGSWSENQQSGGRGFVRVYGSAAPANQCPARFPNCTCRGAGCTHPDLRPWGGDGPGGVGPDINIPCSQGSRFYWCTPLPPSTSPVTLAQQCSARRGTLVTTTDDPWRYFYSGFYATMGCRR
jgi:hypothetical protein